MYDKIITFHLKDIQATTRGILRRLNKINLFLFHGALGSGKTTLIKHFIHYDTNIPLNHIVSPSFNWIKIYPNFNVCNAIHIDAYSLSNYDHSYKWLVESNWINTIHHFSNAWLFIEWYKYISKNLMRFLKINYWITIIDVSIVSLYIWWLKYNVYDR